MAEPEGETRTRNSLPQSRWRSTGPSDEGAKSFFRYGSI